MLGPDGNIWAGSIPDYNSGPTGALSRWDPRTDEHTSWTDLVPGGAIRAMVADDRCLYCAGGGRFFAWDPRSERKVCELELNVSALVLLQDGCVLLSVGSDLTVFDPAPMSIARIDPIAGTGEKIANVGGTLLTADARGDLYFARHAELFRLA
ncbi:MAG: hypothetical protein QGI83_11480 [Candidatus Latescibacteria bacterium]|nr:hypothetical protein [Candidatus Latescibacterota bacterium]